MGEHVVHKKGPVAPSRTWRDPVFSLTRAPPQVSSVRFPCVLPTCANPSKNARTGRTRPTASARMEALAVLPLRTTAPASMGTATGNAFQALPVCTHLRSSARAGEESQ